MHELSIAQQLVETVGEALARERSARLLSVRLLVGSLSGVAPEALLFCYDVASRGTALEGSQLQIVSVPATLACESCGRETPLVEDNLSFACLSCGSVAVRLVGGRELQIESMQVEDAPHIPTL